MLDLNELEQLVAFEKTNTLSGVAEQFHISTPSITRSMQNLEREFGVSLFERKKNKIELNNTGKEAVKVAQRILNEVQEGINQVKEFDLKSKTITIKSCAPAPLWKLLQQVTSSYPQQVISSSICQNNEVEESLSSCDFAILPYPVENEQYISKEFMKENLFVCVKKDHELANRKEVSSSDINGFNFLLRSQLGFWDTMCREKMPASKFLVQTDEFEFNELVHSSSLPCFTTDYVIRSYEDRISIPITDPEAHVTFYLIQPKQGKYTL